MLHKVSITDEVRRRLADRYVEVEHTGEFDIHEGNTVEPPVRFYAPLSHNKAFFFGAFSHTSCQFFTRNVTVGRYCAIAWNIIFADTEHPTNRLTTAGLTYTPYAFVRFGRDHGLEDGKRNYIPLTTSEAGVRIGNDVWIGQNAYLKSGITIGDGAVIGAYAIVTKDVPPFAIVAGNPARIVRFRFKDAVIDRIRRSEWWKYSFVDLQRFDWETPEETACRIEDEAARGALKPYEPERLSLLKVIRDVGG